MCEPVLTVFLDRTVHVVCHSIFWCYTCPLGNVTSVVNWCFHCRAAISVRSLVQIPFELRVFRMIWFWKCLENFVYYVLIRVFSMIKRSLAMYYSVNLHGFYGFLRNCTLDVRSDPCAMLWVLCFLSSRPVYWWFDCSVLCSACCVNSLRLLYLSYTCIDAYQRCFFVGLCVNCEFCSV